MGSVESQRRDDWATRAYVLDGSKTVDFDEALYGLYFWTFQGISPLQKVPFMTLSQNMIEPAS